MAGGALSPMDLWDVNCTAAYTTGVDERHGTTGGRLEGGGDSKEGDRNIILLLAENPARYERKEISFF